MEMFLPCPALKVLQKLSIKAIPRTNHIVLRRNFGGSDLEQLFSHTARILFVGGICVGVGVGIGIGRKKKEEDGHKKIY